MKKKVLDTLKALGFELKEVGIGYAFQFEGKNFLYTPDDRDEEFLSIALPMVAHADNENDIKFYQLLNMINRILKYGKAVEINGDMWLFSERKLFGDEDLKNVLQNMILHLDAVLDSLRNMKVSLEKVDGSDEKESVGSTDKENAA